jgi:YidC/Oxa1 family membrane protein insertase
MRSENTNLVLAIALSIAVLLGWNYFYGVPELQKQRQTVQQTAPTAFNPTGIVPPGGVDLGLPQIETRETRLAKTPRLSIATPSLRGSLSLTGGSIDDLTLTEYRQTVDPKSANVVLLSPRGTEKPYYADFGWLGTEDLPNAQTLWSVEGTPTLTPATPVTLRWQNNKGLQFEREIRVDEKALFTVTDRVKNGGSEALTLYPYALLGRQYRPDTLGFFVLHEGMIGVLGALGLQEYTYSALDKEALVTPTARGKQWKGVQGGFVGITDKYWATALIPAQTAAFEGTFRSTPPTGGRPLVYQSDLLGAPISVAPNASIENTVHLFAGAKQVAVVDGYAAQLQIKNFDLLIDWGWFYFITKPLFKLIDILFHAVGNFGVAILIVTVLLKAVFFPLANRSYASMAKMKAVQPEMKTLQERFKEDRLKMQQELMALYKREKINPLAGCWPVLVQIPVFFALYKVLFVTIEMRHAPFFGWIKDLAAPDPTSLFNLFGLLPFATPTFLTIGVWPILMGITMFVQMKLNPEPTDPIQKTVFTWMPVVFTLTLVNFPAGLVIYWTWNNFLSIIQQYIIMRRHDVKVELFENIKNMWPSKKA